MGTADDTAVKVGPGPMNKGIFVRLTRDGPGKGEVSLVFTCNRVNITADKLVRGDLGLLVVR